MSMRRGIVSLQKVKIKKVEGFGLLGGGQQYTITEYEKDVMEWVKAGWTVWLKVAGAMCNKRGFREGKVYKMLLRQ